MARYGYLVLKQVTFELAKKQRRVSRSYMQNTTKRGCSK